MPATGKKRTDATKRYDRQHLYSPAEAAELVKTLSTAKFDETVELATRLGVDPRRADQIVRGTVALPSGTGKDVRVPVGKVSFTKDALLTNIRAVLDEVQRAKPAATKGKYVRSVTLSSTMGPGIKIDPARLRITDEEFAGAA